MSYPQPIYSQVVPKSQFRAKNSSKGMGSRERPQNLTRTDFDPLNYNHGGNFQMLNATDKVEEKKESRKKDDSRSRRTQKRDETSEGKVEAYLRQNQISMRQQQHRHSAVRQAEHRVNLRSLPLNEAIAPRGHDRTPTDRHRGFPERERDGTRDHRRERERDRDREIFVDGNALSPRSDKGRPVRKSSSAHRVTEPAIATDKRRFFCREWVFQKIAHCLEQRPVSKTCGALILGDAGSGKTALCSELSAPGAGPQARQQRALQRRMLARHFLQGNNESTLRPGEFIRSVAMQILSQSSRRQRDNDNDSVKDSPASHRRNSEEEPDHERLYKFKHLDDDEEISKPLLADSEDQHTDEEECPEQSRRVRTIDRIHERDNYMDSMGDAKLSNAEDLPEILPRNTKPTNPFLDTADQKTQDQQLYENHENVFLRNISQRQSKELRNSRLVRQSSEPLSEKKNLVLQKSLSEQKESSSESERPKVENSPPKSRIPVSNFRYPNKNDPKPSSVENSPHKTKEEPPKAIENEKDLPEYQNVLKPEDEKAFDGSQTLNLERLLEKKRSQNDDCPPPIPSLPINPRTLIADAYYDKLSSEPEIQQALLPQNLEKNPDECFKKALLFPLLEIDPPKQCLFLLVDAIDEGAGNATNQTAMSCHVSTLLARAQHLLPTWLLLVATAHQHSKHTTRMFTGFRKIVLDDLQRAHVSADVQRYVLARLDTEPRLRSRVSSDATAAAAAAAALDHLRIKSDGCLLYLEKVLDGVADGFIGLREIKEIPGTLNGLYLWLAQRLFHGRRFSKVRLLLEVLLAARCGVTEDILYKCLLTKEYSVTRDDFNRRLHLLRRILVMEQDSGHVSLFHHSFASWLVDVKHCTRRYLCSLALGHKALAMYYKCTSHYNRLSPLETHNFVFHMTHLEQYLVSQKKNKKDDKEDILDVHTICLLWILDSGCDIETALKRESDTIRQLENIKAQEIEIKAEDKDVNQESEGRDSTSVEPSTLESIMPELVAGRDAVWPRDRRVLRTLIELSRKDVAVSDIVDDLDLLSLEPSISNEPTLELEQQAGFDPTTVHDLVTRGHVDELTVLLKRHGPAVVFAKNEGETDWSPLRAAAAAAHTEMVELLLEYGCDVDGVDSDNRTALRAAAWSGHEAVVERLLTAGADPDKADTEGRTPLIAAAYMGHQDIVRLLLDASADIHHADHDGRTALSVAALCARGGPCVSVLLERKADVTRADRDNATPLLVAAFEGHTDICELLLEAEADIEWQDGLGRSALWAAAGAGHADTTRLLLYWGASVDNMDHEGRTVLTVAAAQGNVDVVRQLLDRGLDEHHRDNSGWTPLHYAAFEGHMEVCSALLEAGARADAIDNDGKSALMLAAQEGHAALAASLVRSWHAPHHQRAIDGKTPLRLAALEGHIETVSVLHSLGADVDALDADRRSTLYVLALDNRLEMASFLITRCGADVHAPDHEGRTPLHVSAWQGHTEMVNLLIKVGGAAVDARDRCMRTALHAAAWRGRSNVLLALLTHGACVAAVCTQGATPLGIAAQEGHEECVLRLLQHGADPLQADHCGRTPAKVAWRAGHSNICRLLERWTQPQPTAPLHDDVHDKLVRNNSPDYKRRSVHSSNSTKSSSNLTANSRDQDHEANDHTQDKASRANLSLSFVQQVARYGRGRRDREVHNSIPEHHVVEKDSKLRSYMANERDSDIPAYVARRRDTASPLYASPPRSPGSDLCSPTDARASLPPNLPSIQPSLTDTHFNRDTHMRIILGKDSKQQDRSDSKNKRNGIVTNPAMRLVANVRNGLDSAAANIRRTGVALAASASSNNPAVKTNAFQWRKETPL